jgi:hypothetical protein
MNRTSLFTRFCFRSALLLLATALLWGCAEPDSAPPTSGADTDVVMCPMDVIQCSNGDWVGRKAPGCQFTCPPGSQPLIPPR